MKLTKRVICILAVMVIAIGTMAMTAHVAEGGSPQTKCPVLGNDINKNIYLDYQGKRIYFCCAACPKEFMKDPVKYMKKLEEQGVTLETAPKK